MVSGKGPLRRPRLRNEFAVKNDGDSHMVGVNFSLLIFPEDFVLDFGSEGGGGHKSQPEPKPAAR